MSLAGNILQGNAISGLFNTGNATNSYGESVGSSWESSQSSSSNISDAYGESNAYGKVYGTEASAADILRANEANDLQTAYMLAQMQYNATEAEKARAYETAMSNTAYQRQVKDLIAAGLNPILAVGTSGASTPSVTAASGGLQSAHKANTYANQEQYSSSYQKSHSEGHSQSSSSGGSSSKAYNKSETQLKSLLGSVGSAAKGIMQGLADGIYKNNEYSWEGSIRN